MENFLLTNNCTSSEITWVPPQFVHRDIFEFSSQISNPPAENLIGTFPTTPDLSTHNSYETPTNLPCHYSSNLDSVASNSNLYSPFTSLTHRNEPSFNPASETVNKITSMLSCYANPGTEIGGSNITYLSNVPNYSMYEDPLNPIHTSNMVMQQKYLHVMREILFNVASYAVESLSEADSTVLGPERELKVLSSSPICREEMPISSCGDEVGLTASVIGQTSPNECDVVKENLVQMLKMIDQRYSVCVDHMKSTVSEFQYKLDMDLRANMCARFAHHAITVFYKNLRDKISSEILSLSKKDNLMDCLNERQRDVESIILQKHQMKKAEHSSWRAQRGLPEKSVSVLRKWMFQNFLCPYPKDYIKDVLATKSGLTKNQVSNWFINARVRLWKPMIEQMYSELNKTRGHDDELVPDECRFQGF